MIKADILIVVKCPHQRTKNIGLLNPIVIACKESNYRFAWLYKTCILIIINYDKELWNLFIDWTLF